LFESEAQKSIVASPAEWTSLIRRLAKLWVEQQVCLLSARCYLLTFSDYDPRISIATILVLAPIISRVCLSADSLTDCCWCSEYG